jgi:tetratricopeptide (TPR) repeat protein
MKLRYAFFVIAGWVLPAIAGGASAFDVTRLDEPAEAQALREEVQRCTRELEGQRDSVTLHARRGAAFFKLREFDRAIDDFSRAIELDDRTDEAWFGRGMARGRSGDLDGAVADLGVYIERHPRSSVALTKRGIRHLWNGDLERAEADFRQAIRIDPANAEAHDDLGVIHAQRGDYAEAERHFRATLAHDPSYQKAHHNLAMVHYLLDRNEQALEAVERSLRLRPDARDSLLLKSAILESLGRRREAQAAREEAEFLPQGDGSERMSLQ